MDVIEWKSVIKLTLAQIFTQRFHIYEGFNTDGVCHDSQHTPALYQSGHVRIGGALCRPATPILRRWGAVQAERTRPLVT